MDGGGQDLDLTPTTEIGAMDDELEDVLDEYREFVCSPEIDEDCWLTALQEQTKIKPTTEIHSILGDEHDDPYYWISVDGTITIFIHIGINDPIDIDQTSIRCKALSGQFWGPVEIINFDRNTITTTLKIKPSVHFPVIVKCGENIDSYSSYYLSILSILIGRTDFFIKWGTKAALDGCPHAAYFLGRHLIEKNMPNMAIYWLAEYALRTHDKTCLVSLGVLLSKKTSAKPKFSLAENILCDAASLNDSDAEFHLGSLYLEGGGNEVKQDVNKGKRLIWLTAKHSALNQEAIDILKKAHKEINKVSWVDAGIVLGIIGATAGGVFYLCKKFFRK